MQKLIYIWLAPLVNSFWGSYGFYFQSPYIIY